MGDPVARTPGLSVLHDLLDSAAASHPGHRAVADSRRVLTFADLSALSRAIACEFVRLGLRAGDRVLVAATPDSRVPAVLFACSRAGLVFVPLNPATKAFHAEHIIADTEPGLIVSDDETLIDSSDHRRVSLEELCAHSPSAGVVFAGPASSGEIAMLLYTSGSTAMPKGVVCPHSSVLFATRAISARLGYRSDDVVFSRLPMAFDYGLYQVLLTVDARAELVFADPRRDATLLAEIRRTGATVVPVLPAIATMLTKLARRDSVPTKVRLFTNTGEEFPGSLRTALRNAFPGAQLQLMYGITECKRVAIMEPDGDLLRPDAVGRPLDGTEIRVVDYDGRALPADVTGEITVTGPHVMAGYWRDPELTAQKFSAVDGLRSLRTGDFGCLDADGYLYFHGRRDDIFKANGTRTSAREIERAALEIPEIERAVVLPPYLDRPTVLCVVTGLPEVEVRRRLRRLLDAVKVPDLVVRVPRIPLTPNGKADRATLWSLVDKERE